MPKVTAGQLLFIAARDGDAAGAEKALAKRAPPDYRDNVEGMTPLHMACCNGNARVVELLLSKKASTSITTDGGSTALALACINRHTSIVRMLLEAGASADQVACAVACAQGDTRTVKALLSGGAKAGLIPTDGTAAAPPLLASLLHDRPEVARLLLDSGAGLDSARNQEGQLLFLPSLSAALMA